HRRAETDADAQVAVARLPQAAGFDRPVSCVDQIDAAPGQPEVETARDRLAPAIHSPSAKDRASVRRQMAAESDASVPPERVKSRSSPVTETATPHAPNIPTSPAFSAPVVPLNRSCGVPLLS